MKMQEYLTQKNLIISGVVLVLMVVGVALKQRQVLAPVDFGDLSTDISDSDIVVPIDSEDSTTKTPNKEIKKLTYDEYLQQGIGYETQGQLLNAINSYKKASALAPKDYVPYSNIGSAYYSLKKYEDAETALLKALELNPTSVSVYTKLYEVYFLGMRRVALVGFFQEAMEKTGNNVSIIHLYASYLENVADLEGALKIWESLLKAEPENTAYKAKVEALQKKVAELQ